MHYYAFIGLVVVGLILFSFNPGFFFGLVGRTSNLTGRIPLWQDLFSNFYMTKPWLGYGYGALWMQESFRVLMQTRHNWPYPVYFADNGFFDILLNLGVFGLGLFLAMYFKAVNGCIRAIIASPSWEYFFLFFLLLYATLGNLAYSFLLEVDQFVWMLLVLAVFLLNNRRMEDRFETAIASP
jgi:O-antigen ligase